MRSTGERNERRPSLHVFCVDVAVEVVGGKDFQRLAFSTACSRAVLGRLGFEVMLKERPNVFRKLTFVSADGRYFSLPRFRDVHKRVGFCREPKCDALHAVWLQLVAVPNVAHGTERVAAAADSPTFRCAGCAS